MAGADLRRREDLAMGAGSSEVTIRGFHTDDAESLAQVHVQAWKETYRGILSDTYLYALSASDRLETWRGIASRDEFRKTHWVAEDRASGEPVGFIGLKRPEDGTTQIWGLYVLSRFHGRGLGRLLMQTAVGEGAASLWVAAGNDHAIGFYRHLGFDFTGEDAVVEEWDGLRELKMARSG